MLLVAVADRYGWHRDELYFLEAGRHLEWGFVDQPPFTPFVARVAELIAPGNLLVLRLLPAVATGATVVMGGLIVRELGGTARQQLLGSAAVASSGFVLGVGHLLSTATFDLLAWMSVLWLVVRMLRTADPRWWLAIGAVAGLSMLNKNLVVLLGVGVAVGLVADRRWALLLTPWLAIGAVLAVAIAAPNLWWQATNGWPQFEMAEALSRRLAAENRTFLLPMQILFAGPLLIGVLVAGTRWLRTPDGSPYRALLWAWPAGIVAVFVTGGRPYYALPFTLVVLLAGIRTVPDSDPRVPRFVGANAALSIVLALPVLPLSVVAGTTTVNEVVAETVGWPELVEQVAGVVDELPPDERTSVVLLTASYGEAGAIDRFGAAHGLPPAFSPHNGYADFRRPTDPGATVVSIRYSLGYLHRYFGDCEQVATVDNGLGVDNESQGQPIVVCRDLRAPWPDTWERLRHLS